MKARNGRFHLASLCVALALTTAGQSTHANDYPSRPVKLISQGGPGSGPDIVARLLADYLGRKWGQQVLVLNQPGAGGAIAAKAAAAAEPDGYTLYMPASTAYTVLPETPAKPPFDLDREFIPIAFVSEQPMIVAVHSRLGIGSLQELIALTKQKPGEVLYAGTPRGQLPHLTGELLRARAGIEWTFVPYPSGSQALQDVLGGRTSVIIENVAVLSGLIEAGTLKALAASSPARVPNFPDLPIIAETFPGLSATGWFLVVARAGTPEPIVRKLRQDLTAVLAEPDVKQRFLKGGSFVRSMSPEQISEHVASEQAKWRPLVRQINLTGQ